MNSSGLPDSSAAGPVDPVNGFPLDKIRGFVDLLPQFIAYTDKDRIYRYANETYYREMKIKPQDLIGSRLEDVLGPEAWETARPHVEKVLSGEPVEYREVFKYRLAGERYIHGRLIPDFGPDGRVLGYLSVLSDVSELMEAQNSLNTTVVELKLAQEIAKVGNWSYDPTTARQTWSDEIYKIYERDPREGPLSLEENRERFEPAEYASLLASIEAAVSAGEPYSIDLKLSVPSGQKWIRTLCQPAPTAGPAGHFLYGTVQDITAIKNAEIQLEMARQSAEEAALVKSNFLAMVSHEMRTPLNPIIGLGNLLEEHVQGEEAREILAIIQSAGERLYGMVSALLNMSKIQADSMKVEKRREDLPALLDKIYREFLLRPAEGVQLILAIDPNAQRWLETDFDILRQIIENLLTNAFKFTDQGKICLIYKSRMRPDLNRVDCCIIVRDTGLGISEEFLEKIFEPFYQVEQGRTRSYQGAGLGLSLCRKMAELLGGELSVSSELGKGSEFTLRLPATPEPASGEAD